MNGFDLYAAVAQQHHDFLVVEVDHPISVLDDRSGIAGEVVIAVFTDPYYKGASFPRSNEFVRIAQVHYHDGVGAVHLREGHADRLFQRESFAHLDLFDQFHEYFCIGLTGKRVAFFL